MAYVIVDDEEPNIRVGRRASDGGDQLGAGTFIFAAKDFNGETCQEVGQHIFLSGPPKAVRYIQVNFVGRSTLTFGEGF
ncbi:MAG: hypothetical protein EBQ59_01770 [Verrucomicrobia bacterium]|nr:hypothetical protein [Verrucomicrobiota bacterium]